jgi:hypothetical protein
MMPHSGAAAVAMSEWCAPIRDRRVHVASTGAVHRAAFTCEPFLGLFVEIHAVAHVFVTVTLHGLPVRFGGALFTLGIELGILLAARRAWRTASMS